MYCITWLAIYIWSGAARAKDRITKKKTNPIKETSRTHLDMTNVCGMPLGANIIVLQDTRRVEIVDVALGLVLFIYLVDLINVSARLGIRVALRVEAVPKRHEDDLGLGVHGMHLGHEVEVALQVLLARHGIMRVVVIRADVDEHNVSLRVGREIPERWGVTVEGEGARRRVDGAVPLVFLTARVTPAVCVVQANARVGRYAELDVAETSANVVFEKAKLVSENSTMSDGRERGKCWEPPSSTRNLLKPLGRLYVTLIARRGGTSRAG